MKIVLTGAAGLIGQNLTVLMKDRSDIEVLAIDKHPENCAIYRELHPEVKLIEADLAVPGEWAKSFDGADLLILNHAQIGALTEEPFVANNVTATEHVLDAAEKAGIQKIIHISSSVVNSIADDFYTRSKTAQEKMVLARGIPTVVLRPTLMFGLFDRKHLGWLARFMQRKPVFPVPGSGEYIRQPLFARDFCNVIMSCVDNFRPGQIFDISGQEKITYIDLVTALKEACGAKAKIIRIPYVVFWWLLRIYAILDKNPPFTTRQLEALVIPEEFEIIDWPGIFNVPSTTTADALHQTYNDPKYSSVTLEF
ncbi:NAD-dependent epimerase/dehydratase family protein [Meridianimarinicoccus aquatilis]|uniref:NAD-dependent epimerase/dehydratase family protein n=1 Tax=Meridianimarinicoccus aquatilis TaxID=2552766 RepID=A0A4R6B574_9RHOB|nr:NAD-dependent epimerase/dehydratase family protein [Fluviibacterium aquatile]TDL90433.1 NAD-dependent epimerase/dehydratase family protein [Fluviibacterium aquatile]